jgi:1-aminocyclopropane-1-carboxylate deaminase/D-cysteine desulfhydrase-like pyridoxal-dependent ACC family enzyme
VTPLEARRREAPIFAEFPELERTVPFRSLIDAPTRVEPCLSIEAYLGRGGVFHKRDDQVASLYGGNKIRRFEYLLADAERRGARHLITAGGLASTQVMATVLFGRALGFDVTAALFDQPVTAFARKALLTSAAGGGELIYGGSYLGTALGALLELGEQVRRGELPRPDVIVVPAGSGGTLAGLAVGASILRWPTLLVGVRITEAFACNRATIRLLIESTARFLKKRARRATRLGLTPVRFALHHGAIGDG